MIGNAIKFTTIGGITVNIKQAINGQLDSLVNEESLTNIIFSVCDTGIGIKPEDRDQLFNVFSKLKRGSSMNKNGTGLGLYISRSLVKELGGEISIKSNKYNGSTFKFNILVRQGSHEI